MLLKLLHGNNYYSNKTRKTSHRLMFLSLFADEITQTILETKRNAIAAGALALELEIKLASCSIETDIEGEDSVEY